MASNASIFKATSQIADMDRHYYEDHALTLARHLSETEWIDFLPCPRYRLHHYSARASSRFVHH